MSSIFDSFNTGIRAGSNLQETWFKNKQRKALPGIADMLGQGDYNGAAQGLISNGMVNQGISTLNTPYQREQQSLQQSNQDRNFAFRQSEAGRQGEQFNRTFDANQDYRQKQLDLLKLKNEAKQNGGFTKPFQAVDKDGNTVFVQADDQGNIKTVDGYSPNNPIKTIDTGTNVQVIDSRTGQVLSSTPKQNSQEAFDKETGKLTAKVQSESRSDYSSMKSKMPGLRKVVDRLSELSDKATYTFAQQAADAARRQAGMKMSEGGLARAEYIALVDNQVLPLLRDTFGAAFTAAEGQSLRATLGDPDKSPGEKKRVLNAFIEQKQRTIEALGDRNREYSRPNAATAPQQPQFQKQKNINGQNYGFANGQWFPIN